MDFSFLTKPEVWTAAFGGAGLVGAAAYSFIEKQQKKKNKAKNDKQLSDAVNPIIQHVEENRVAVEETKVALESLRALVNEIQDERDYYREALTLEREERKKGETALLAEIAKIKQERTREGLEYQATIKQLQGELLATQNTSQQLQGELEQVKAQLGAALALNEEYISINKELKARLDKRGTGELSSDNAHDSNPNIK